MVFIVGVEVVPSNHGEFVAVHAQDERVDVKLRVERGGLYRETVDHIAVAVLETQHFRYLSECLGVEQHKVFSADVEGGARRWQYHVHQCVDFCRGCQSGVDYTVDAFHHWHYRVEFRHYLHQSSHFDVVQVEHQPEPDIVAVGCGIDHVEFHRSVVAVCRQVAQAQYAIFHAD